MECNFFIDLIDFSLLSLKVLIDSLIFVYYSKFQYDPVQFSIHCTITINIFFEHSIFSLWRHLIVGFLSKHLPILLFSKFRFYFYFMYCLLKQFTFLLTWRMISINTKFFFICFKSQTHERRFWLGIHIDSIKSQIEATIHRYLSLLIIYPIKIITYIF